jgi:hypothetical protein
MYNVHMAGGRSSPPLYELLRSDSRKPAQAEPPPPPPPEKPPKRGRRGREDEQRIEPIEVVVAEPKPARDDGPDPLPEAARSLVGNLKKTVSMPLSSLLLLGLAGLLLVASVVWVVAVKVGEASERQRVAPYLAESDPVAPPADPLAGRAPPESAPASSRDFSRESAREPSPPPPTAPATRTGEDPREPGLNYLALATLPQADAEEAVAFLARHGVAAVAVPVDRGTRRANNPRYQVFTLVGITGTQYRGNEPIRQRHEAEIRRLGEQWLREGGASNFAQPQWTRYNG